MSKLHFQAMGCQMSAILDTRADRAERRLASVPRWFEEWEHSLSRFRPDSDLSRLNDSPETWHPVSSTLWQVFQAAVTANRRSNGLVNPLVMDAILAAGYTTSFDQLVGSEDELDTLGNNTPNMSPSLSEKRSIPSHRSPGTTNDLPDRPAPALSAIAYDECKSSICLPAGSRLDLGGVAKGWAAHTAMRKLQAYGPALVDAGGDIAISGPRADGEPWQIGVANPFAPEENLVVLQAGRCGIATSGKDRRRWRLDGHWQHHIIDPRSGRPADTDLLTATVIAPDVLEAETASKVILILGSHRGSEWLQAQPQLSGLLVREDGQILDHRL